MKEIEGMKIRIIGVGDPMQSIDRARSVQRLAEGTVKVTLTNKDNQIDVSTEGSINGAGMVFAAFDLLKEASELFDDCEFNDLLNIVSSLNCIQHKTNENAKIVRIVRAQSEDRVQEE